MSPAAMPFAHITPHPQSLSDPVGRLFECDGELLRGITTARAPLYERLLDEPARSRLFAAGLVRTERAQVALKGYPLVLRHRRVDFVSDWREWSSLMLRDAALAVCELCLELSKHDCGILDIHPWNVLFDFARPVFVDFSAVAPLESSWLDESAGRFRDYWILPLTFISMGHPHFARSIRKSCEVTEPLDELLKRRELSWFPFWYYRLRRGARRSPQQFFERLKGRLESLPLPGDDAGLPDHFADDSDASLRAFAQGDARARTISSLLDRLKPKTLLDVGCGAGRYALLAERRGVKVVAIDEDEARVNALYRHAKSHQLEVLPLVIDFSIPTVGQGRKKEFPPATERLACDAVLLLSLLERLVFDLELSFERVANLLAAYTRRHAVVEFTPPGEGNEFKRRDARFSWFGKENFIAAMERHFRFEGGFELEQSRRGSLLLFEKR
jgi:SAM-dependent methyltransferase